MKMTSAMPTPFQTSTRATDSRAMFGSVSHCGPSIPTTSSDRLIRPVDGCISTANVMPTATVLTRTGKKMTERSRLPGPEPRGEQRRQQQPDDDLEAARHDRVDDRVPGAAGERRLLEELDEVVEPDELGREQRPAGQAEVERQQRRDDEDQAEDDARRQVEPVRVGRTAAAAPGDACRADAVLGRPLASGGDRGRRLRLDPRRAHRLPPSGLMLYQPGSPSCFACFATSWS